MWRQWTAKKLLVHTWFARLRTEVRMYTHWYIPMLYDAVECHIIAIRDFYNRTRQMLNLFWKNISVLKEQTNPPLPIRMSITTAIFRPRASFSVVLSTYCNRNRSFIQSFTWLNDVSYSRREYCNNNTKLFHQLSINWLIGEWKDVFEGVEYIRPNIFPNDKQSWHEFCLRKGHFCPWNRQSHCSKGRGVEGAAALRPPCMLWWIICLFH